jgi:hypothetical protein
MDDQEFKIFHDKKWSELPQETRDKAKRIILAYYKESALDQIRDMHAKDPIHWGSEIHFGGGMGTRNLLRTGVIDNVDVGERILDSELPSGNWDDYYIAALEYAAGIREE